MLGGFASQLSGSDWALEAKKPLEGPRGLGWAARASREGCYATHVDRAGQWLKGLTITVHNAYISDLDTCAL
jgi:hypothetical protein